MPLSEQVDEDAMVMLVQAGPLQTPQGVADFLDGTDEERALIISNCQLQGVAPTSSSWDQFLAVMGAVLSVAGAVTGITSAITGAYALKSL